MAEVFGAVLSIKDNVSGVMKQARESTSAYRGEVDKAKKQLEKLEKQKLEAKELKIKNSSAYQAIEGVKKKLEPITKKTVEIKAKTELAIEKVKKFGGVLDKVKSSKVVQLTVKGAAQAAKAVGKAALVGTAAAFTAVTVASGAALTKAADYQSQMQNVGTLLDGDVKGKLQEMSGQLKQVSIDTGAATSDLTDGLYQVVSAFGESSESVKQLEIAAKAAKAGNATTTDSVNMLSAVTKGYGDTSAAALQKASDLAFMTVKLGQTSFPELASSMGQVIPLAATLKVSQEELFGAMSTLTGVTGSTSEVTTQLKAAMQSFLSPSAEMEKTLKKMGYASGAAALESEGLGGILTKLKGQVNGDEVAFANLFSSVEAKNAVLALTGAQAENFAEKTAAMEEAAGATQKAFDTQTASVSAMAAKLKNAGSVMLTSLGEQALPYVQSAMESLLDKMPEITGVLGGVIDRTAPLIGRLAGGLAGLVQQWAPVASQVGGMFGSAVSQAMPALQTLRDNLASLPAAGPAVTGLAGVVAAAIPPTAAIFSGVSGVIAQVMPVASQIISDLGGKISSVFGSIGAKTGLLQQIFSAAGPAISGALKAAWSVAGPILDLVLEGAGLLADAIGWAFPYVQSVIEAVWSVIGPIIEGIGSGISKAAEAVGKVRSFFGGGTDSGGGTVAANATGTPFFSGGWTQVGEHGPELMKLPAGTQILSNGASEGTASGRQVNITVQHMEIREEADVRKVAEEFVRLCEEAEDNQ